MEIDRSPLKIGLQHSADGVVLSVDGDIDTTTGTAFEREFARALALMGNGDLIVDMAGVSLVDDNGILALLRASEDAVRHGVRLVVRRCRPTDAEVVDILSLFSTLDIESAPTSSSPSPSPRERSPWDAPDWAASRAEWPS